jgi:hypothetical protein
MLIIGQTSEEKGNQLEQLAAAILSKLGYSNIITNRISNGGEEIDVTASFAVPSPGIDNVLRLICECKAYRSPVAMSDWLKFLGKCFSEERLRKETIFGCFIALSGVNGNVAGHYDGLSQECKTIKLVSGDDLLTVVTELYNVCALEVAANNIRNLTDRQIRHAEIAYYQNTCLWIVAFQDDSYAVLDAQGNPYNDGNLEIIANNIEACLAVKTYVNLSEEVEAKRRFRFAKKTVLGQLMADNGATKITQLLADNALFAKDELLAAIAEMEAVEWVTKNDEMLLLTIDSAQTKAEVFRFFLDGEIPMKGFASDFYDNIIDEQLLAEIQRIQGNLPLSSQDVQTAIQLMRWSPEALLWSLKHDPMLTTHRVDPKFSITNDINAHDRNYFLQVLSKGLMLDFRKKAFSKYFFIRRQMRSINITRTIEVTLDSGRILKGQTYEKQAVGQLVEEYGGGYVLMLGIDEKPRPWEWLNASEPNADGSQEDNKP